MEHSRTRLDALLTGSIAPLGHRKTPSGIAKTQTQRPLRLGLTGLEGDTQGDTRNHGGPEKALHHYAFDHYDAWRAELGALAMVQSRTYTAVRQASEMLAVYSAAATAALARA